MSDSKWYNSSFGYLAGMGILAAGIGVSVGASEGYYGGNVKTVRFEMDNNTYYEREQRNRIIALILKDSGDKISSQDLSDILKKLADQPFKIEVPAEKKE